MSTPVSSHNFPGRARSASSQHTRPATSFLDETPVSEIALSQRSDTFIGAAQDVPSQVATRAGTVAVFRRRRWVVLYLVLPWLGLACPVSYLLVPMAFGCTVEEGGLSVWSWICMATIQHGLFSTPCWVLMSKGLLPCSSTVPVFAALAVSMLGIPGSLLACHLLAPGSVQWLATAGSGFMLAVFVWLTYMLLACCFPSPSSDEASVRQDGFVSPAVSMLLSHALLEADLDFEPAPLRTRLNEPGSLGEEGSDSGRSGRGGGPEPPVAAAKECGNSPGPPGAVGAGPPLSASPDAGRSPPASWAAGRPSRLSRGLYGEEPRRAALLYGFCVQAILVTLFFVAITLVHWLMNVMLSAAVQESDVNFLRFVNYIIVTFLLKEVLKAIGFVIDSGKANSEYPAYYVGEICAAFFYYFFYRAMFEHVKYWSTFALLHGAHLAHEWLGHPVRSLPWYFHRMQALADRAPCGYCRRFVRTVLLTAQQGLTPYTWACFVALDSAVRFYAAIYSLAVYMAGVLWLHYGYNRGSAQLPSLTTDSDIALAMLRCSVLLVTEAANALVMELWFRRRLGPGGSLLRLGGLLRSKAFRLYLMFTMGGMATDVWIGYLPKTFCLQ